MKDKQEEKEKLYLGNSLSPATNVYNVREYTCVGSMCVAASLEFQTAFGVSTTTPHDIFAHSSNDLRFMYTVRLVLSG